MVCLRHRYFISNNPLPLATHWPNSKRLAPNTDCVQGQQALHTILDETPRYDYDTNQ
jgi:hypothetical protein